jgi:hypothetical protein
VADAVVWLDQRGFTGDHSEHIPFRADLRAALTADAIGNVDMRMLAARPFREDGALLSSLFRPFLSFQLAPDV